MDREEGRMRVRVRGSVRVSRVAFWLFSVSIECSAQLACCFWREGKLKDSDIVLRFDDHVFHSACKMRERMCSLSFRQEG